MTSDTRELPAPSTLRERRQRRTRQELVDAVLAVIGEIGADGLTIERVSQASGISRGTVYAHFPGGRDELLRAAYARLGRRIVANTQDAVSHADGWKAQIEAHARAMFDLATDPRLGHFYNVSGPTLVVESEERGIGSGASLAMIREILALAQHEGEVDAAVDAHATAMLLIGSIREAAMGVASGAVDAERSYAAFSHLLDGLVPRPNVS